MATITQRAEDALKKQANYISSAESLKYLSKPQNFQSFAKYMKRFFKEKNLEIESENLGRYLAKIVLALEPLPDKQERNIKNLFSRVFKPDAQENLLKMDPIPREIAIKLCFALKLDIDESTEFLQKACNTYSFNVRDEYEATCFYCILTGQDYSTVQSLLEEYSNAPLDQATLEVPHQTKVIAAVLSESNWESNEHFLNTFLIRNKLNFTKNSQTAAQKYRELRCYLCEQIVQWNLDSYEGRNDNDKAEADELFRSVKKQIIKLASEDPDFSDYATEFSDMTKAKNVLSKIEALLSRKYPDVIPGTDLDLTQGVMRYYDLLNNAISSYQLIYHTLWGIPYIYQATKRKTTSQQGKFVPMKSSILENSSLTDCFPKRFPSEAPSGMPKDLNARKTIILLYFLNEFFDMLCDVVDSKYRYFKDSVDSTLAGKFYDSFCKELNDTLEKCSMPCLYPATPFDWLILKSVRAFSQLDNDVDPIAYFNDVLRLSFPQYSNDYEQEHV